MARRNGRTAKEKQGNRVNRGSLTGNTKQGSEEGISTAGEDTYMEWKPLLLT